MLNKKLVWILNIFEGKYQQENAKWHFERLGFEIFWFGIHQTPLRCFARNCIGYQKCLATGLCLWVISCSLMIRINKTTSIILRLTIIVSVM